MTGSSVPALSASPHRPYPPKGIPSASTDNHQDTVRAVITDFLVRTEKKVGPWTDDTGLWGGGLGLDSLEAAELSAMLEDTFGTDPFSTDGDLPERVGDVVAFYAAVTN